MKFISSLLLIFCVGCSQPFETLYKKGQVSFDKTSYVDAIDHLNLALSRWKDSDGQENKAQAYQLLGKSYHELKKIEKAMEAYKHAIELSTSTFDSASALGYIYLSEQPVQAIKTFKIALTMKKDDPLCLLGLGHAYYEQKQYADARTAYQRLLDTSPGVRDALQSLQHVNIAVTRAKAAAKPSKKPRPKMGHSSFIRNSKKK